MEKSHPLRPSNCRTIKIFSYLYIICSSSGSKQFQVKLGVGEDHREQLINVEGKLLLENDLAFVWWWTFLFLATVRESRGKLNLYFIGNLNLASEVVFIPKKIFISIFYFYLLTLPTLSLILKTTNPLPLVITVCMENIFENNVTKN